eukprot:scaffold13411_cov74-Skeletonema_marinoi.AAC.1
MSNVKPSNEAKNAKADRTQMPIEIASVAISEFKAFGLPACCLWPVRTLTTLKMGSKEKEKDADPIGIDLCEHIAKWAREDGTSRGINVWASSVTQWNCIGRHSIRYGHFYSYGYREGSATCDYCFNDNDNGSASCAIGYVEVEGYYLPKILEALDLLNFHHKQDVNIKQSLLRLVFNVNVSRRVDQQRQQRHSCRVVHR